MYLLLDDDALLQRGVEVQLRELRVEVRSVDDQPVSQLVQWTNPSERKNSKVYDTVLATTVTQTRRNQNTALFNVVLQCTLLSVKCSSKQTR